VGKRLTKLAWIMCGCVFSFEWVCEGEQLSVCLFTALGLPVGDDKEPWQINTATTIYNLNSSHILYVSVTSGKLTLASITDITGGLELTRTELWISNSNVSQMRLGLYTSLCPSPMLDCNTFVLWGWYYNSVWLQCEKTPGMTVLQF